MARVSQDSSPDGPFLFVTLKSQAERGDYGLQDAQKKTRDVGDIS